MKSLTCSVLSEVKFFAPGEDVDPWGTGERTGCLEGSSVRELLGAGAGQGQPPEACSPVLTSWVGMDDQRVAPGTQSAGISGMWFWAQIEEGGFPPSRGQGIRWYHRLVISSGAGVAGGHVKADPKWPLSRRPPPPTRAHLAPPRDGLDALGGGRGEFIFSGLSCCPGSLCNQPQ